MDSALRCVHFHSLNCGCEGKGKWLLMALMRNKLQSGLVVLGFLFRCIITSIKESQNYFFNDVSLVFLIVTLHFYVMTELV